LTQSPNNPPQSGDESPPVFHFHLRQLALQGAAVFIVLSLAWPFFIIRNTPLPWFALALAIGGIALILATVTRQAWWWRAIHTLFAPLSWCVNSLSIDPGWYLLALILLLLAYRGALTGQIPLYLSNSSTSNALAEIVAQQHATHLIDLGAGIGSILSPLAKTCRNVEFTGVENAPIIWLAGYLRTLGIKNCLWRWGNLWDIDLGNYEVVYAFLSPAPMTELWRKVEREMRPGSLFISNSFPVPDIAPTRIIEIGDNRQTRLYCYLRSAAD